jgi:hypothetical protein
MLDDEHYWDSWTLQAYRQGLALSAMLLLLVRSEVVDFIFDAWAELLLCDEPFDPAVVYYALESRQHCGWIDAFLVIVERSAGASYYVPSSSHDGWKPRYPNIEEATMSRLLRERRGLWPSRQSRDPRLDVWSSRSRLGQYHIAS